MAETIVLGRKGPQVPKLSVRTDTQYLLGIMSPETIIHGRILKSGGYDPKGEANAPKVVVDFTHGALVEEIAPHIKDGENLYVVLGPNIDIDQ